MGAGKTYVMGGPLSPKAILKKGGKSARLADFMVGEAVKVKWHATDDGHLILALDAK